MKLNIDCVRQLLLYIEENQILDESNMPKEIDVFKLFNLVDFSEFSKEEIIYTASKLFEANFINLSTYYSDNMLSIMYIEDITYEGHEFLETIRDTHIWKDTKEKANTVGSFALPIIQNIATQIISNKINTLF